MAFKTQKKIIIRFDSGNENGIGHAKRCLKIANKLRKRNHVILCCNKETLKVSQLKGFKIILKKQKETEENFLKSITKNLSNAKIVIDKLYKYKSQLIKKITQNNNRLVLIQNYNSAINKETTVIQPSEHSPINLISKIKKKTKKLFYGKNYIILDKKFRKKPTKGKYLAINFGGSDPKKITLKIVKLLNKINFKIKTFVLVGPLNDGIRMIKKINRLKNLHIMKFEPEKLFNSNMVICSFGIMSYELIHNKIFSLNISHSTKHSKAANLFEKKYSLSKNLGVYDTLKSDDFNKKIHYYWNFINSNFKKKF